MGYASQYENEIDYQMNYYDIVIYNILNESKAGFRPYSKRSNFTWHSDKTLLQGCGNTYYSNLFLDTIFQISDQQLVSSNRIVYANPINSEVKNMSDIQRIKYMESNASEFNENELLAKLQYMTCDELLLGYAGKNQAICYLYRRDESEKIFCFDPSKIWIRDLFAISPTATEGQFVSFFDWEGFMSLYEDVVYNGDETLQVIFDDAKRDYLRINGELDQESLLLFEFRFR